MKFWLFVALALGLYAYKLRRSYQGAQVVSDEEIAESLETDQGRAPAGEDGSKRSLHQTLKLFVDEPWRRIERNPSAYVDNVPSSSEESQKSPDEFREAFSKLPLDDVQGRLANLYSFRGSTPEEKQSIRETLTHEFESQARQEASSGQRAYLLEIQRIYLDHIEEPDDAEKNMQKWLGEFPDDRQFQDALKANFLGRFPQFAASWEGQGMGIGSGPSGTDPEAQSENGDFSSADEASGGANQEPSDE